MIYRFKWDHTIYVRSSENPEMYLATFRTEVGHQDYTDYFREEDSAVIYGGPIESKGNVPIQFIENNSSIERLI